MPITNEMEIFKQRYQQNNFINCVQEIKTKFTKKPEITEEKAFTNRFYIITSDNIITGNQGRGLKKNSKFLITKLRLENRKTWKLVLRPTEKSMTLGTIAKSNKHDEVLIKIDLVYRCINKDRTRRLSELWLV